MQIVENPAELNRVQAPAAQTGRLDTEDAARALETILARDPNVDLRGVLAGLHPADLAYVLEALPLDERQTLWALVRQAPATHDEGDVLLEVSDAVRETLIEDMSRAELVDAVGEMDADEVADLAPDLPRDVVEEVASGMSREEREQLRTAMSYAEDSVGARMDFDMVTIRNDVSLEVVLRYLRRFDALPPQTDQVFVVDRDEVFQGSLPLDILLLNEPEVMVAAVLRQEVLTLNALDDMAEAAQAFERYDLVSAPVLDAANRLIGRLTIDEVVDEIRESGEEQVLSQAGLREDEDTFANLWDSFKNRAPWLLLNLCTAAFASYVASRFEGTVEQIVMLAFLMSIVAGIGGNSGNQTMTLMIPIKVSIAPESPSFQNQHLSFYNTYSFVDMKPNRAMYGTKKSFMPVLTKESVAQYQLPQNVFMIQNNNDTIMPPFILSSAGYYSYFTRHISKYFARKLEYKLDPLTHDGVSMNSASRVLQSSSFQNSMPSSDQVNDALFKDNREFLTIPYLPYFSNCTFYGSQLFLYPIIESHPSCKLVKQANIEPISNMKFGMNPVADTCKNVIMQCR